MGFENILPDLFGNNNRLIDFVKTNGNLLNGTVPVYAGGGQRTVSGHRFAAPQHLLFALFGESFSLPLDRKWRIGGNIGFALDL